MNRDMTEQMAARLDSTAARLMRLVRQDKDAGGFSAARISALSVISRDGPLSLRALAAAEQVRAPTMSRIVDALVCDGLVVREQHPDDRRSVRISATERGAEMLEAARRRRVRALTVRLDRLGESEKRALLRGVELLERTTRA